MHFALAALLLAAPVPPEAAPQTHANLPPVVTGTIVGGIAYGLPLGTAAVYSVLVVPLIATAQAHGLALIVAGLSVRQTDAAALRPYAGPGGVGWVRSF